MDKAGLGRAMFAEVDPNPNEQNLEAGLKVYRAGGHDGVIAFGGGSGLDLGKMVAFMAGRPAGLGFRGHRRLVDPGRPDAIAPIVAVPTTAGTGSEVGRASVITNSETHVKKIIFHPKVLPSVVICRPGTDRRHAGHITAGTGMDAFAHCLEAYSQPVLPPDEPGHRAGGHAAGQGVSAARASGRDRHRGPRPDDGGGAMGAVAFQKGLGAIHALSHPVGAVYNTHHGTTNAVCIPPCCR
jgi:alcohol dehydrogenase